MPSFEILDYTFRKKIAVLKQIKILLVEHNDELRILVAMYLNEKPGFSVVEKVSNAFDALRMLEKYDIDLIVTCILMPIMDGFMLLERIQKMNLNPRPIVIVLSSLANQKFKDRAYKLGASSYLVKPINPELICTCIRESFNKVCH